MLIAQITDLHIRPRGENANFLVNTNAMLKDCVEAIQQLNRHPDVVLATGDLTDAGLVSEYEMLRELLEPLEMPVYLIPGNHDSRTNMRKCFPDHSYLPSGDGFLHYVIDDYPVTLIGLDTVVQGHGYGDMCPDRLAWLDQQLARHSDKPVVIFMHHPPFPTGITGMDRINCNNGPAMADIVRRYPNVERVLVGHHHRPIQIRWAGTIGSVAPSSAHQVQLDLTETDEHSKFIMEPPAFHLHLYEDGVGIISHQAYIGTFDGPHPFGGNPDYPPKT